MDVCDQKGNWKGLKDTQDIGSFIVHNVIAQYKCWIIQMISQKMLKSSKIEIIHCFTDVALTARWDVIIVLLNFLMFQR